MLGFIHESVRALMIRTYDEDFWMQVINRAGFEAGEENIVEKYYPDEDTFRLIDAVSTTAKIPKEQIWEDYGAFLIEYTMSKGWDEMMRSMSPNFKGFLDNLDSLHYFIDNFVYKANLKGPSFRCEAKSDGTVILHYFSTRAGLYPIVKGVMREVAKRVFDLSISLTMTGRSQRMVHMASGEHLEEHVTFQIHPNGDNAYALLRDSPAVRTISNKSPAKSSDSEAPSLPLITIGTEEQNDDRRLKLSSYTFAKTFPFHILMDSECKLIHPGLALWSHFPSSYLQKGTPVVKLFRLIRPQVPFEYESIVNFINAVFLVETRTVAPEVHGMQQMELDPHNHGMLKSNAHNVESASCYSGRSISRERHLRLKGQMILLDGGERVLYMCSPEVTSVPELFQYGLRMNDMPLHDTTRDMLLLNQQRLTERQIQAQLESTTEQLSALSEDLEREKKKTESLLHEVLPPSVATEVMRGRRVPPAEFDSVTVMFTDMPDFQTMLAQCRPKDVVQLLNELFTQFDRVVSIQNVYKVETIGDSYMLVCGAPERATDHCERVCHVALGFVHQARSITEPMSGRHVRIRIGMQTGAIVAGIIGEKMPRYCLFGDTVNTASRMESHGVRDRIHCSDTVKIEADKTGRFLFHQRGRVDVKGKGMMVTYFLLASLKYSVWEIVDIERDLNKNSIAGYDELHLDGIDDTAAALASNKAVLLARSIADDASVKSIVSRRVDGSRACNIQ